MHSYAGSIAEQVSCVHFFFQEVFVCQIVHGSLAVGVLIDQINNFLSTAVEFVFDVEDFNFCNAIQSTAHCNCSSSTAGSDQDHLHSL